MDKSPAKSPRSRLKQDNGQEGEYFLNVFQNESNIVGFGLKCNGGWILGYGSSIYPRFYLSMIL